MDLDYDGGRLCRGPMMISWIRRPPTAFFLRLMVSKDVSLVDTRRRRELERVMESGLVGVLDELLNCYSRLGLIAFLHITALWTLLSKMSNITVRALMRFYQHLHFCMRFKLHCTRDTQTGVCL